MIRQPHLLFRDVELFEVEDHLLLQTVRVRLDGQLRQIVEDACADGLRAGLFERRYLVFIGLDLVHTVQQVGDEDGPFLRSEFVEPAQGVLRRTEQGRMFRLRHGVAVGRDHVGQPQHGLYDRGFHPFRVRKARVVRACRGDLRIIGVEGLLVDVGGSLRSRTFDACEQIDLAALQRFGYEVAQVVFRTPVCRREFDRKIQLLGVERADFDGNLLILYGGFAFAEACHGFDHCARKFDRYGTGRGETV